MKEATDKRTGDGKSARTLCPRLRGKGWQKAPPWYETERGGRDRQPPRESKQRQKFAGWGTTCTGTDPEDRGRGWVSGSRAHLSAPRPAPSRSGGRPAGGRFTPKPPSARKSHFPDTTGALAELCEECPRRARAVAPPRPAPPPSRACARDRPRPRSAPVPPRTARKARSPWQRDYRRRALFILSPVPGNSARRLPGVPPRGGGAGEGGEGVDQRTTGSWGQGEEEGKERVLRHWGGSLTPSEGKLLRKYRLFPSQEWIKFSHPTGA